MNIERQTIFMFGAGGHAKVVLDMVEQGSGYMVGTVVDDDPGKTGGLFCGHVVHGGRDMLLGPEKERLWPQGVVAIGDNRLRLRVAAWLVAHGFSLVDVVHPSAVVGRGVRVDGGTVVMAGTVINPDTTIGANVIVNTGATVDHDCVIADGVHLGPGSVLCGNVRVGRGSLVGAGVTVAPDIVIGAGVTVGAGATVVADLVDHVTVVGTPARSIRQAR